MGKTEGRGGGRGGGKPGGDRTAQRNKFYKYCGERGGRGGGRGGRGGRGRGGFSGGPKRDDGDTPAKSWPLDQYRESPYPDMFEHPGIFVSTTKDRERQAEEELMQYLERLADDLYPETVTAPVAEGETEADFEELLAKELDDLKGEGEDQKSKRFRLCSREGFCLTYVNVLPPLDPCKLVRAMMEQAETTAKCPLKHCQRLLPMPVVGGATLKQLGEVAGEVVKTAFQTPDDRPLKFAIVTNSRFSGKLERMDMILTVAEEVTKLDKGHSVDLKNPDLTILVEVAKNSLGVVALDNYDKWRKYNPSAVAQAAGQALARQHQQSTTQPASTSTTTTGTSAITSQAHNAAKIANRERRADGFAEPDHPQAPVEPAGATTAEALEEGEQKPTAEDVEVGEVVEDETMELGEEFEERIEGGKVVRVRKSGE
ncbi:hypothetical protein IAT38_002273 [Cryptococcus sp. DSM 104549]